MTEDTRIAVGVESRALIGLKAFLRYLGVSNGWFQRLVAAGLPAEKRLGRWIGNKDQVDRWFTVSPPPAGGEPPQRGGAQTSLRDRGGA